MKHKCCLLLLGLLIFATAFQPDTTITWRKCSSNEYQTTAKTASAVDNAIETKFWVLKYLPASIRNSNVVQRFLSAIKLLNLPEHERDPLKMQFEAHNLLSAESLQQDSPYAFDNLYCADIKLPLKWDDAKEMRYINFHLRKNKALTESKGALFLLQGGPGGDGSVFWAESSNIQSQFSDFAEYDIIMPDHRGTGRSHGLYCNINDFAINNGYDSKKCLEKLKEEWGASGLQGFSTTNAAKDVEYVAKLLKEEAIMKGAEEFKTVVYGVSYGTYWLNRLLQISPQTVDFAVADSVVSPDGHDFFNWDPQFEEVGNNLLNHCQTLPDCAMKFRSLSNAPNYTAKDAYKDVLQKQAGSNACHKAYTPRRLRRIFANFLAAPAVRELVLPMIYRLHRCNPNDYTVLDNLEFSILTQLLYTPEPAPLETVSLHGEATPSQPPVKPAAPGITGGLNKNIACSELGRRPAKRKELEAQADNISDPLFYPFNGLLYIYTCEPYGDGAYEEPLVQKYPTNFNGSLLTLTSDGYDPQTGFSQTIQHWTPSYNALLGSSKHQMVTFPFSTHGVISPSNYRSCAWSLIGYAAMNGVEDIHAQKLQIEACRNQTLALGNPFLPSFQVLGLYPDAYESIAVRNFRQSYWLFITVVLLLVIGLICCIGGCITCCICCCVRCCKKSTKHVPLADETPSAPSTAYYSSDYKELSSSSARN